VCVFFYSSFRAPKDETSQVSVLKPRQVSKSSEYSTNESLCASIVSQNRKKHHPKEILGSLELGKSLGSLVVGLLNFKDIESNSLGEGAVV
jgi:hypothetical protein